MACNLHFNFFIDILLYSQAVQVDKTLYISGQLGLDTQTGSLVPGGVEAEAKKALDNMGHILEAAGISYKNGNAFLPIRL